MGTVSVLKTDIKGGGLPHFTREKRGELRQAFPPLYIIRCKLRSTIGKGRGKQASAGERHSSPTTSPKSLRNAKKALFGHFSLKKNAFLGQLIQIKAKLNQFEPIQFHLFYISLHPNMS